MSMIASRFGPILAVLAIGIQGDPVPGPAVTAGVRNGAIEGRVVVRPEPARRRAERYLAGAATAAPRVQSIPAVVFIRGEVPGSAVRPSRTMLAQQDSAFTPAVAVVPVGSTVAFPNRDDFFHNVFSYSSPKRFDLGRYPRGESKAVVFDEPGIVRIYCEVHESMRSAVIVSENPYWAVVGEDGRFAIADVPPGRYQLEVWHPDHDGRTLDIEVVAGRTTSITAELE
jgi:plastocyanin